MERQEEDEEHSAYRELWKEKIPDLITGVENNEGGGISSQPLVKLQSTYAPLIRKIDITVFKNGEVGVWKSKGSFTDNSPEVNLKAQLGEETLTEIKRLLDQEDLQKQKSCFEAIRDGHTSTLTLNLTDKLKVIYNKNCEKREFSLPYQYLDFLLSSMLNIRL